MWNLQIWRELYFVCCLVEDTHASHIDKVGHISPRKFPALHVINFQHPIHATHAQTSTETLKAVYFSLKAKPGSRDMSGLECHVTQPCIRRPSSTSFSPDQQLCVTGFYTNCSYFLQDVSWTAFNAGAITKQAAHGSFHNKACTDSCLSIIGSFGSFHNKSSLKCAQDTFFTPRPSKHRFFPKEFRAARFPCKREIHTWTGQQQILSIHVDFHTTRQQHLFPNLARRP